MWVAHRPGGWWPGQLLDLRASSSASQAQPKGASGPEGDVDGGLEAAVGDGAAAEHRLGGPRGGDEAGHLLRGRGRSAGAEDRDVPRALRVQRAAGDLD